MKSRCLYYSGAVTLAALGALAFMTLTPFQKVHAQASNVCSNASFAGSYGYQSTGYYGSSQGTALFTAVGAITADGNGNLTGAETASQNGTMLSAQLTGTYQVTAGCTGTMQLIASIAAGQISASNMSFVVVNNGLGIQYMQTDAGTVISGSAQQQFPASR